MPRPRGRPPRTRPPAPSASNVTDNQNDPPITTGDTPPAGDPADVIDALMLALRDAKANKADTARQDAVVTALAQLKQKDYPDLADNPAFQQFMDDYQRNQRKSGRLRPGQVINPGTIAENTVPWSFSDLKGPPPGWKEGEPLPEGHTQWVFDVIPERNTPVIVNGMRWFFFQDVPYTGPKVFWDQYLEMRRSERTAAQHAAWMLKTEGAGAPQDPTVISEASLGVRTHATKGTYYPGMGTAGMTAPPPAEAAEAVATP